MNMAQHWPHIIASIMSGFTCCVTGWWYLSIAAMPRLDRLRSSMEIRRRDALRSGSTLYRDLEPVVDDLSTWFARPRSTPHPDLSRLEPTLILATPIPWQPEEYLAVKWLEGIGLGLTMAGLALLVELGPVMAMLLVMVVPYVWAKLQVRSVVQTADLYRAGVRRRLAFAMDLMALMLEAGAATFGECLEAVERETGGTPLGTEFQRARTRLNQGAAQKAVLSEMDERLDDVDVQSMVLAVNTAEERGSKLKDTLRNLAEQMRIRQIQRMEKAAEEAKVQITFPAMVVMVACLLLVAAPIMLTSLY